MTWVRLDDSFPDHPKIAAAGDQAAWLYVAALCWSSRHLTDGHIPATILARLTGLRQPGRLAGMLVSVGLWEAVEGGWQIHDYAAHQRTSTEVTRIRDRWASVKRGQRATSAVDSAHLSTADNPADSAVDSSAESAGSPRTRDRVETENPPCSPPLAATADSAADTAPPAGPASGDPPNDQQLDQVARNAHPRLLDRIIAAWVAGWRASHDDHDPPPGWPAAAANRAAALLAAGSARDDVAAALDRCTARNAHPRLLDRMLADITTTTTATTRPTTTPDPPRPLTQAERPHNGCDLCHGDGWIDAPVGDGVIRCPRLETVP